MIESLLGSVEEIIAKKETIYLDYHSLADRF